MYIHTYTHMLFKRGREGPPDLPRFATSWQHSYDDFNKCVPSQVYLLKSA